MKTNLELYRVVTGGYRWLQVSKEEVMIFRDRQTDKHTYLIFVIFLNGQNFWKIKFTPKFTQ